MSEDKHKVIIVGGNGFVGSECAKQLVASGADVVCVSRTGHKPTHLHHEQWSSSVRWCKSDAANLNTKMLSGFDSMVISIGSAPLPTFSEEAFEKQLHANGTCCVKAIESAKSAGIDNIVLLGAQIPFLLRSNKFAYFKGKQLAFSAAQAFSKTTPNHRAVVLQPGVVIGKRTLSNGRTLRIDWFTAPFAAFMPWQFVSVERVAKCVANAALGKTSYKENLTVITNKAI